MSKAKKTYDFEIDGTSYSIPAFSELPVGAIRKARKAKDDTDMAFTILEQVIGEDSPALEALDTLTADSFGDWLTGWTQGAPVGESSSSSR